MPLLMYNTLAVINFLDAIGVSPGHLAWFVENEEEFKGYQWLHQLQGVSHWVCKQLKFSIIYV